MLKNLFQNCGLNDKEQKIIIYLLVHGKSLASTIAKRTNIKRTTVYNLLDNLSLMGLIHCTKNNKLNYYTSLQPQMIAEQLNTKAEQKLSETKLSTRILQQELEKIQRTPSITQFGFNIMAFHQKSQIYAELMQRICSQDFCGIFNPQAFSKEDKFIYLKEFLQHANNSTRNIREIAVSGPITDWYLTQLTNPNHQVKIIDKPEKLFLTNIVLIKNSIVFTNHLDNMEASIIVDNQQLYETFQFLFNQLWKNLKQAQPPQTK